MAVPRAALLPDVARHQNPLHTDGAGDGLGSAAATDQHGHFQRELRQAGQTALRRHPLPGVLRFNPTVTFSARHGRIITPPSLTPR